MISIHYSSTFDMRICADLDLRAVTRAIAPINHTRLLFFPMCATNERRQSVSYNDNEFKKHSSSHRCRRKVKKKELSDNICNRDVIQAIITFVNIYMCIFSERATVRGQTCLTRGRNTPRRSCICIISRVSRHF